MNVVVVESPAKAKTINKYLGPDFVVLASFGHVRDLPAKDGSVKPDEDFAMMWEVDPASAKRVMETLSEINSNDGITVIVALHQVEDARRYCPRTIALRDGEIAFDGPSLDLTHDLLRELYGDASEELVLPDVPEKASTPQAAMRPAAAFAGA